jgi:Domain of unknown function (DUF4388)
MSKVLSGDLKQFAISNLVQLNCEERNSSQVTIDTIGGQARIFFDKGDIVHACYNDLKGEQALYQILRLKEGGFQVFEEANMPLRTIHTSMNSLLLEGMRIIDENSRDQASLLNQVGENLRAIPGIIKISIHASDGSQIFSLRNDSPLSDYALARLTDEHSKTLIGRMHFGKLEFANFIVDKIQIVVVKARGVYVVVHTERERFTRIKAVMENLMKKPEEDEGEENFQQDPPKGQHG